MVAKKSLLTLNQMSLFVVLFSLEQGWINTMTIFGIEKKHTKGEKSDANLNSRD